MERLAVARMATAKLQGWIHAARGMGSLTSIATKLNNYAFCRFNRHLKPMGPTAFYSRLRAAISTVACGRPGFHQDGGCGR
jgi:hypothetical protein